MDDSVIKDKTVIHEQLNEHIITLKKIYRNSMLKKFVAVISITMLDFFQQDKESGDTKGIISINLEELS